MPRRLVYLCLLVALALVAPGSALAQGPVVPMDTAPTWHAAYWNNTDLAGPPALEREERDLDHDWGSGSPDPSIARDGFSARWTRYIDTAGGAYRFTATADDGIRVGVDGRWIIDQWRVQAATTFTADVNLAAGHHLVTVEYYENNGGAVCRVSWAPASDKPVSNWRGEYFNNKLLQGSAALVRDDRAIDFNWGDASPAPGTISPDTFSVRWTRTLRFTPGTYHFSMTVDDGGRLWVNGHLLIDVWMDQSARTYTGDIYVPGGDIPIKMEYYENSGSAAARLTWTGGDGGTQPPAPPPPPSGGEIVVDDGGAGFVQGGSATAWRTQNEGYGGHLTWTRNNDRVRANYNWARWYPHLSAGRYEVFVYIPDRYTTTGSAHYWVSSADGFTQRTVDQSAHGDQWVSLGTYQFRGTNNDYVSLSDVTYEFYLSRLIAFDAVKWVPR
jgi:hypothetical protein